MANAIEIFIILAIYFLPWMIAWDRHHRNKGAIFALNLLLGWTLIGWVIAVVWGLTDNTKEKSLTN